MKKNKRNVDKKCTSPQKKRINLKRKSPNIKLIDLIIIILILSVLFLGIVGTIGQLTVKKVNDNTDRIYNDQLVSIINIGEIQSKFLIIRYNVSRGVESQFYYEFEKDIKSSNEQIKRSLDQYENTNKDEYQKNYIGNFITRRSFDANGTIRT